MKGESKDEIKAKPKLNADKPETKSNKIKMGPKLSADKSEPKTKVEDHAKQQTTEIDSNKSNLVNYIRRAINTIPSNPTESHFAFQATHKAAEHNYNLIKEHQFDIQKVLDQEKTSCTAPSYEFQDRSVVFLLFECSSDSDKFKEICFEGMKHF